MCPDITAICVSRLDNAANRIRTTITRCCKSSITDIKAITLILIPRGIAVKPPTCTLGMRNVTIVLSEFVALQPQGCIKMCNIDL